MNLRYELERRISTALVAAGAPEGSPAMITTSARAEFGDYQANGVMSAAKKLKTNPRQLATKVAEQLAPGGLADLSDLAQKVEIAGPGFINIHLKAQWLAEQLQTVAADEKLGVPPAARPQTVVVDYSAPNLAKEMHVGHLRSTIIGDALARTLEFLGNNVIRQNHVGDWGTQFGMLLAYFDRKLNAQNAHIFNQREPAEWRDPRILDPNAPFEISTLNMDVPLQDLEQFYREAKAAFDTDPLFADQSRRLVVELQSGNSSVRGLWQMFVEKSMDHAEEVYRTLGVSLKREDVRGESAYNADLPKVVADLEEAGLVKATKISRVSSGFTAGPTEHISVIRRSARGHMHIRVERHFTNQSIVFAGVDGIELAKCVFLPQFVAKDGTPQPLIIQKSDGGYLYATTDLAAIRYRVGQLHADRVLYVVDARQSLHFQMVFATARAAKFAPESVSLEHIAFGTMMGDDGKPFKTRTGGTVKLMDLLSEAVERAFTLVSEKSPDIPEGQRRQIAQTVGVGGVKYADLAQNRNSDYVFSWDKMLSMDGNTAPYMQYAYTRVRSIFRKGAAVAQVSNLCHDGAASQIAVTAPAERSLAVKLMQFPETIAAVASECLPSLLCGYLYDLAGTFMSFYESCPVLQSDAQTRASRLALCDLTARTIKAGLSLLGIQTLEQM